LPQAFRHSQLTVRGVHLKFIFHYFTDHFDGKLGNFRDRGLRKWGFYMDHLVDYGFLCSILIGYFVPDATARHLYYDAGALCV